VSWRSGFSLSYTGSNTPCHIHTHAYLTLDPIHPSHPSIYITSIHPPIPAEAPGILLYYAYRPLGGEERREAVARWYEEEAAGMCV
jgi:hypothetical protein